MGLGHFIDICTSTEPSQIFLEYLNGSPLLYNAMMRQQPATFALHISLTCDIIIQLWGVSILHNNNHIVPNYLE